MAVRLVETAVPQNTATALVTITEAEADVFLRQSGVGTLYIGDGTVSANGYPVAGLADKPIRLFRGDSIYGYLTGATTTNVILLVVEV